MFCVKNSIFTYRFVVPYNRGLLVKYQAHINVEWCNRALSIKYLFKYISKGPDRATMIVEKNIEANDVSSQQKKQCVDEVKDYLECRYVSAAESCWRIFQFPIHFRNPTVQRLYFHLENEQNVTYRENEILNNVLRRIDPNGTMFIQWMRTNIENKIAKTLTYIEFPEEFWWDPSCRMWEKRKKSFPIIGRLVYAHPTSGERFYLRMLLNIVRGPKSYEDIRTVGGTVYSTFKEACFHRGLLESDGEWHEALLDAAIHQTGRQLRDLFVIMLLFCDVGDVCNLWQKHWSNLADDMEYIQRRICSMPNLILGDEKKQALCLYEIDLLLRRHGKSLKDFPTLPSVDPNLIVQCKNRLLQEELNYDHEKLTLVHEMMFSSLNSKQRDIYTEILNSVNNHKGGLFFVYGHGGTGKTFLWQTIIAKLRSEGRIVLAVASSGIASLLIEGGRTAHSRFRIPLDLDESSSCDVKQNTMLAELICKTDLIIWDEAPMNHRHVFEAVDRTFKDILRKNDETANTKPFGGKTFLLGGDFRQILPVLPKKGREDIVLASINRSHLWKSCKVMRLTENMRLQGNLPKITCDGSQINFAEWVIKVGEGRVPVQELDGSGEPSWIEIPKELLLSDNGNGIETIIQSTYGDLLTRLHDTEYLHDRAILTPLNGDVGKINSEILKTLPGESRIYKSSDSICKSSTNFEDHELMYPVEFLNSLKFNGIPNHELELKIGVPIMLLRNINPSQGLCNGTRLIITQLSKWIIEGRVISGKKAGQKAFIPRIVMTPTDSTLPFVFKRRQFPVVVCYAMTINKSQGQTLKRVGLYLPKPVFSHGQLYVAISRVTSPEGLKIVIENVEDNHQGYTKNVVYLEIFNNI